MPTNAVREIERLNASPITHVWIDTENPDYYEED
jgi:hypothetical protein